MYYSISGSSGFGVYEEYSKAIMSCDYISKVKIIEFKNFDDAIEWAVNRYNSFHKRFSEVCSFSADKCKCNWVYFVKDIMLMNMKN